MWIMLGQLEEKEGDVDAARNAYAKGTRRCPDAIPLWCAAAALEASPDGGNAPAKARAVLEQARLRNPANETLWLTAARQERGGKPVGVDPESDRAADALMAKALQECPASGMLWAEAVRLAPRPQRKSKSVDALKRCDNDPAVIASIANLFWLDRKMDKARGWFNRAVTLNPDVGDHWAAYFKFETRHGDEDAVNAVVKRCAEAAPKHGEAWCRVAKRVENWHEPVDALLRKCAREVDFGE